MASISPKVTSLSFLDNYPPMSPLNLGPAIDPPEWEQDPLVGKEEALQSSEESVSSEETTTPTDSLIKFLQQMVFLGAEGIISFEYPTKNGVVKLYALTMPGDSMTVQRFEKDPEKKWIQYTVKEKPIIVAWDTTRNTIGTRENAFLLIDACTTLQCQLRWLERAPYQFFLSGKEIPMK